MNDQGDIVQGRIWRPKIEVLSKDDSQQWPRPGFAGNSSQQFYTKTSLVANENQDIKQYNREVLCASQSFNNSPKPFTRAQSVAPPTTTRNYYHLTKQQSSVFSPPSLSKAPSEATRFGANQQAESAISVSGQQATSQQSRRPVEENMAPKLIHKQYNSPIDLYSMNNIRKTIEAHTELLAPGIKGINFMKPDTPVNKQSEVYKLVMEEESQKKSSAPSSQHQQQHQARLSPISGQPITMPSGLVDQSQQEPVRAAPSPAATRPICCECGQHILGPFARLQNGFIHPQCFNCTTCGTSLKNLGYFTVNEKLYCEIHAKQVANIMRINYDFSSAAKQEVGGNQQEQRAAIYNKQLQREQRATTIDESSSFSRNQAGLQSSAAGSTSSAFGNNPATISTMFANRDRATLKQSSLSESQSQDQQQQQQRNWSWQPLPKGATSAMANSSGLQTSTATTTNLIAASNSASSSFLEQQQGTRGRSMLQDSSQLIGGRVPICLNCRQQIHGPYILAGKTTWCKSCSQNEFNCSSCKRSLLNIGFIELLDGSKTNLSYLCEHCFEAYHAPICSKCNMRIKGDCLNALSKQWHPSCFICGHCQRPFGNSSFYLEDSVPYCERDWNLLFTTKCHQCLMPIQAGDKWIEALDRNYHSSCFKCSSCQTNLEGSTFYCKAGKPYCRLHAR